MIELTYDERWEIAYQEGRAAAVSGNEVSRFTPGTPMHDAWAQGRQEGLADNGWQALGTVLKRVVRRVRASADD